MTLYSKADRYVYEQVAHNPANLSMVFDYERGMDV